MQDIEGILARGRQRRISSLLPLSYYSFLPSLFFLPQIFTECLQCARDFARYWEKNWQL